MTMSAGEVSCHGMAITVMTLSILEAMAPAPEPCSDVPQERSPAISVVPTATSQPRLPEATSSPGAQRVRESETLTAASPPGQEVLPALADSQELEEPPAPLVAPEHEQPSAPAGGVTEGLEQPPAATEQPASAPHQRLMLVCHDRIGHRGI